MFAPTRDENSELSQNATQIIETVQPTGDPLGSKPMQRLDLLLFVRFEGHRHDIATTCSLDEGGSISPVCFGSRHLGSHILCGAQLHLVTAGGNFPSPVMRAAASLHDNPTRISTDKKCRELRPIEPVALDDFPIWAWHGDFKKPALPYRRR